MKNKTDADDKLAIMNRQLFNKRETIILPEESHESVPYSPVKESVLAGMLASFEKLGYKFSYNDIRKIPVIYDLDDNSITILNMATHNHLDSFGKVAPPDTHRHFDLPPTSLAIENYAGILAQTVYYIDKRIMQDKASLYDLAMLNVEARNGVLTDKKHEADVIFALDRKPVREGQKLVTIYDKDVINTEYMVPKA